jgi:hypothetical protein
MGYVAIRDSDGDAFSAANPLPVSAVIGAGGAEQEVTLNGETVATTGTPAVSTQFIIAINQNTSNAVVIGGALVFGIEIPAGFEATAITFQASQTLGGTYVNVYDDSGVEVSAVVAPSRMVSIDAASLKLAPYRFIKIRSGTSGSPTTCLAERILRVISK